MQTDLFELMKEAFRHYGINVVVLRGTDLGLSGSESALEQIDFGFRKKMTPGFDYQDAARSIEDHLEPGICYLLEDDLMLTYSLYRFSPKQAEEFDCSILSLGPVLFHPIEKEAFQNLMAQKGVAPSYHQDYLEFYNHLPLVPSYDSWNRMVGFFLGRLCGGQPEFRHLNRLPEDQTPFLAFSPDYTTPSHPTVALTTIEARYRLENALMEQVAAGNTAKALQTYYAFLKYRLLPRIPDPVRNKKNLLFVLNTLLRKAAEAGYVHPLYIDALSRQLAIQIESCFSLEELDRLSTTMVRKYCILVNNHSRRPYSPLVTTCLDYIDFHYNENLSLASLAELCSASDSYLSALFKKETGMTVTDYINQTRIRQSLILLNSSNLAIGEIAAQCGFSDTNYFSRIFKKLQGQSPKQYRNAVKRG